MMTAVGLGGLGHLRVDLCLRVLARKFILVEEDILRAHEADALGAVFLEQRHVLDQLDVARDRDAALVES